MFSVSFVRDNPDREYFLTEARSSRRGISPSVISGWGWRVRGAQYPIFKETAEPPGGLGQTALPETHLRAFVPIGGWTLYVLGVHSKNRIGDISLAKVAKGAKKY